MIIKTKERFKKCSGQDIYQVLRDLPCPSTQININLHTVPFTKSTLWRKFKSHLDEKLKKKTFMKVVSWRQMVFSRSLQNPLPTGSVLVKSWPDWPKGENAVWIF